MTLIIMGHDCWVVWVAGLLRRFGFSLATAYKQKNSKTLSWDFIRVTAQIKLRLKLAKLKSLKKKIYWLFKDSAVQHGIVQRCSFTWAFPPRE